MSKLIAKKNWVGIEGRIFRGQEFYAFDSVREDELVNSGRAIYASKSSDFKGSLETIEINGGSKPSDVEVKDKPKRKRRTKSEIELDKETK